jgi:hypothetical protein
LFVNVVTINTNLFVSFNCSSVAFIKKKVTQHYYSKFTKTSYIKTNPKCLV